MQVMHNEEKRLKNGSIQNIQGALANNNDNDDNDDDNNNNNNINNNNIYFFLTKQK